MSGLLRKNNRLVEAGELSTEILNALSDSTRMEILRILSREPSYPAEVARELDLSKQQAHYHFEKLRESGLLEEERTEKRSGGTATFYSPSEDAYILDLGVEGEKVQFSNDDKTREFLHPLVQEADLEGKIVVGSPDQHGPDSVRARDGHLAGEIALKLGNYAGDESTAVKLDTEVARENLFDQNLLMVGGVLTNTVTRRFNDEFPVSFTGESFPYHRLETPDSEYSEPVIGVVEKASNPESDQCSLYLVAGIRSQGTKAAVLAFKDLENLVSGDVGEDFYAVVEGKDMDGDGEIDSYSIREIQDE